MFYDRSQTLYFTHHFKTSCKSSEHICSGREAPPPDGAGIEDIPLVIESEPVLHNPPQIFQIPPPASSRLRPPPMIGMDLIRSVRDDGFYLDSTHQCIWSEEPTWRSVRARHTANTATVFPIYRSSVESVCAGGNEGDHLLRWQWLEFPSPSSG